MDLRPAGKSACAKGGYTACNTTRRADRELVEMDEDVLQKLERRLGRLHARQRIGIEDDHEARVFGQGRNFFHPENWYYSPTIIRNALKLTGLYWRARKNAERIEIRHVDIRLPQLPSSFDGYTILQISDLHVDMNGGAMERLIELLPALAYDLCVLTGDYRGKTFGPFDATIAGMARMCAHIVGPIYGVLGNHDSVRMVPALEEMGIRMLLNEAETLERKDQRINLVGIDALITTESTILKRPRRNFLVKNFRSCCRIRPRSIAKQRTPISICCSAAIRMVARSVCPARSRSPSTRRCLGGWVRGCGNTATWSGTPRLGSGRASSPRGSTALRRSPCITCGVASLVPLVWPIAQAIRIENAGKQHLADEK